MSDLIKRSDAIEAVVCHIWHLPNEVYKQFNCENIVREVVEDAIRRLPSAEAKHKPDYSYEAGMVRRLKEALSAEARPTGKWIFNPKDAIELMFTLPKCSKCGFESVDGGNFCSNCGARMKGADDE